VIRVAAAMPVPLGGRSDGRADVAIPAAVDLRPCPIVETSAQKIGQQEHRASVLHRAARGQEQTDQSG